VRYLEIKFQLSAAPGCAAPVMERNLPDTPTEAAFEIARRVVALGHQITGRPAMLGVGRLIGLATQFPTVAEMVDATAGNPASNSA